MPIRLLTLSTVVFLALVGGSVSPVAQRTAPAPAEILGFTPGDDYRLADLQQVHDYFRALDEASDRVHVYAAGKSTEGNDLLVAVISSEANVASRDRYRAIARRLAHVRGLDDQAARRLAREGKAIVWIDNGLHASEVATVQHALTLAYRVATEESLEMAAVRDNVILVLLPTINPDGHRLVVDWYRKHLGTPYQDSPMPWLYQKYVGHDNNRDFFMQTQAETQVVNRLLYADWLPQVMYNQHQGTWPPRIFVPPFPDPFNPNIDPQVMRGIDLVGGAMLHRFEREGKDGVISRYAFSAWYNGSVRTTAYFHNIIGILTETGHASATPFTYDPNDFPAQLSNGVSTREPSSTYPRPWKGGTLRLRDAVDYMTTGSLGALEVAAKYREALLYGIYQIGRRQIDLGRSEAPAAYVVSPEQHDLPAAALFLETLMRGAVDVHRAEAAFEAEEQRFPEGSWVIRMDQPFRPFARDLLEPQRYPDLRTAPGGPPSPPYDTAGWTLALQMGVKAVPLTRPPAAALSLLTAYPTVTGALATDGTGPGTHRNAPAGVYLVGAEANNAFRVVNRALAEGFRVRRTTREAADVPMGAFVIEARTAERVRRLEALVVPLGVTARHVSSGIVSAEAIRPARLGVYKSWAANMDEGWTRWLLEQYGFAYTSLHDADIRAGALAARFDVIVLPDQSARAIELGHQTGPRPRNRPWNPVPPEYRGGLGQQGIDALKAFVADGGTVLAFDEASDFVLAEFGGVFARVRNPIASRPRTEFYCPGSVLRIEVDRSQPLAWGMAQRPGAYFADSRAFEADAPGARVVARYARPDDLLMSGWLLGADHLAGLPAILDVTSGDGRVVLYGFRPQFRAQPHGTFKLVFNALYQPVVDAP